MAANNTISVSDLDQAIDLTIAGSDQRRVTALTALQNVLCAEAIPLVREKARLEIKLGVGHPRVAMIAELIEVSQGFAREANQEVVRANLPLVSVGATGWATYGLVKNAAGVGLPHLTVALYDGPTAAANWAQAFGYSCTDINGSYILKATNAGVTPLFLQVRNETGKPVYLADASLTPHAGLVSYNEIVISGEPVGCPPPAAAPPATVDLKITAADSPDPVTPEITLTYTLTVTNQSQIDAKDVKVTDTLSAQTTFVSASGNGFTCTHSSGVVTCTLPTLAAGATGTITIVVKVSKDVTHGMVLSNTATVTATAIKPDATNNTAVTTTSVVIAADLSIVMTDAPDPVVAGQNLTYTLIVTNQEGASAAQNVTVTGAVPANTTFDSAIWGTDWTPTVPSKGGTGNIVFSRATVAPGESATFKIVVNVNKNTPASTVISNTAKVTSTTFDKNSANNNSTTTTAITPSADLSVIKTNAPKEVAPSGTITYTVTISNNGPDAAENVTVTDTIPANTTLVSTRVTAGNGWTPNSSARATGAGDVVFSKPTVSRGETAVFEIVVSVNESTPASTVINNTATVRSTTTDPNSDNNAATTPTIVKVPAADLSITKTDTPDPVAAGRNVIYTLQLTNPVGASAAQSVTVTDAVPANTTFVSASVTSGADWTVTPPPKGETGNVVFAKASVAPGESAAFQITVNVNADTTVTSITNTATVASPTSDPNSKNNTSTVTTTVIPAPRADLQITKVAAPADARNNVTYTLTVTNAGPAAAQNVTVTDAVPANTIFVSAVVTSGADWTMTLPKASSPNVVFSKASVASGESAAFQITVQLNLDTTVTSITNTATVASSISDPNPRNNTSTVTFSVIPPPSADLQILKTDDPNKVAPGGIITYTLTLTNAGPSAAQNVTVTDAIPANTTFFEAVWPRDLWTATTPAVGGTGNVVFSKASVAAGENVTFRIAVKINQNTTAPTIINTATVASTTSDPVPTNNATPEIVTKVRAQPQTRAALLVFSTIAPKTTVHVVAPGSTQTRVTFINNAPQDTALTDSLKGIPVGFQVAGVTLADATDAQLDPDAPARLDAVVKAIKGSNGVSAGLVARAQLLSAADRTQLTTKDSVSIDGINDVIYFELLGLATK